MTFGKSTNPILCYLVSIVFARAGLALAQHCSSNPANTVELLNYQFMWLDFWCLLFVACIGVMWLIPGSPSAKAIPTLIILALFGGVSMTLVFSPSSFPPNGFLGDKKFLMSLVGRLITSDSPTDYYYKDLPLYYPPAYYLALGTFGKIFHYNGYEMIQIGFRGVFLFMPFLVYAVWRLIVSRVAALYITVAIFIVDIAGSFNLTAAPHAFIANSFFVPWWLYYIQGVGNSRKLSWKQWVAGSIIGALILSTYLYSFFILGFWLILVTLLSLFPFASRVQPVWGIKRAWLQIMGVGLFSSPYWLPNLLAVLRFGLDRSRGGWYHETSGGFEFPFLTFELVGIAGLLAIVYSLWRLRSRILSSLLWLLTVCLIFYLLGSALATIDFDLNLTKDREFTWAIMNPLIGLAVFSLVQSAFKWRYGKIGALGIITISLLLCVRGMITFTHSSAVESARKSTVPSFGLTPQVAHLLSNKVLLAWGEEIYAFIPVYAFINVNEHYAHPASQFALRYDFLSHLTHVRDSRIMHTALRSNKFDAIDYLLPNRKGDSLRIHVALSNFPNKLTTKVLPFPAVIFSDSLHFGYVSNTPLIGVNQEMAGWSPLRMPNGDRRDTIVYLSHVSSVQDRLESDVSPSIDSSWPADFPPCVRHLNADKPFWIDKRTILIDCHSFALSDSLYFVVSMRINRPIVKPRRVYLHLYEDSHRKQTLNHDFPSEINSSRWEPGDVVTLVRAIPTPKESFGFVIGLFDEDGPVGEAFNGHLPTN